MTVLHAIHVPGLGELELVAASAQREPGLFRAYRRGHVRRCKDIGTPELAASAALPRVPTTLVLAAHASTIVGGVCVRKHVEIPDHPRFAMLHVKLVARRADGVGELRGLWMASAWLRRGIATHLLRAAVDLSARSGSRWVVGVANHLSLPALCRLGFEPDPEFADIPFPTEQFRTTVAWYDHHR